jgi:hypothetical protein
MVAKGAGCEFESHYERRQDSRGLPARTARW